MKLLKTGIGLSLMSVLALNVNGENVAMAQEDGDDNGDADTEEVETEEESTETEDGAEEEGAEEDVEVEEDAESEESSEVNTDEAIDLETLLENGYEAQENIETLYLETSINVTAGEVESETITREWYKNEGDMVLSRTEMENPDGTLTTMVNNGTELISYTEGQDQAFVSGVTQPEDEEEADVEGEEESDVEGEEGVEAPDTEPVAYAITASAYLESLQDIYEISVEGTEQVGDRDAYKVNLDPIEDSEYAAYATPTSMWIDAEHYIILKQEIDDGTDSVVGSEFITLEVNEEEFEDSLFELELPEDVELVDGSEPVESSDTESTEEGAEDSEDDVESEDDATTEEEDSDEVEEDAEDEE